MPVIFKPTDAEIPDAILVENIPCIEEDEIFGSDLEFACSSSINTACCRREAEAVLLNLTTFGSSHYERFT